MGETNRQRLERFRSEIRNSEGRTQARHWGRYIGVLSLNDDGTIKGVLKSPCGAHEIKVRFIPEFRVDQLSTLIHENDGYQTPFERTGKKTWRGAWYWPSGYEYCSIKLRDPSPAHPRLFAVVTANTRS